MQASGGGAGGAEGRDDQNSSRMRPSQSGSGRAEDAQRHQGLIRKEFAVNGNDLLVRWTAEDLAFIRLSINPFLDQLSRLIRNTQRHGLPPRQSLG